MPRRTWLALAWTLLVIVLCLLPRRWVPERPTDGPKIQIPHLDKAVHASLFGGFGLLWMRAASGQRVGIILGCGALLAVATELGQGSTYVRRDPDVFDGLADLAGLAAGVWAYRLIPTRSRAGLTD